MDLFGMLFPKYRAHVERLERMVQQRDRVIRDLDRYNASLRALTEPVTGEFRLDWPDVYHVEKSGCPPGSCAVYSQSGTLHYPAGECPATECYYPRCRVPSP